MIIMIIIFNNATFMSICARFKKHSEFVKSNELYLHYRKIYCRVLLPNELSPGTEDNIIHKASETNFFIKNTLLHHTKYTAKPKPHLAFGAKNAVIIICSLITNLLSSKCTGAGI
jgi:hypothetical protein